MKIQNSGKVNMIITLAVVIASAILAFASFFFYDSFVWPKIITDGPIPNFVPSEVPPLPPAP